MGNMARTPLVDGPATTSGTAPQTVVPVNAATVSFADSSDDQLLILNPAGLLALLTVALPSEAKSKIGQTVRVVSLKAITVFSITGATTILNGPNSMLLGAVATLQKVAANTWVRL